MRAGALGVAADGEPAKAGDVLGARPDASGTGVAASAAPPNHRRQFTSVTPPPPIPAMSRLC